MSTHLSDRVYSLAEVAFLTGRTPKDLAREFDGGVLVHRRVHSRGAVKVHGVPGPLTLRELTAHDVRYFCLMSHWGKSLSKEGRGRVYNELVHLPLSKARLTIDNLSIDLSDVDAEVAKQEKRLEVLQKKFTFVDGDVEFRGTDISVYQVAALMSGQSVEEIIEDYPSLSAEMIQEATDYAKAYPKKGKPYPSRSMKRTLVSLADAGVFDFLPADDGDADSQDD